jgi:hypothetical protein
MKIIVAAALAVGVEMTSRTTAIAIAVGALLCSRPQRGSAINTMGLCD